MHAAMKRAKDNVQGVLRQVGEVAIRQWSRFAFKRRAPSSLSRQSGHATNLRYRAFVASKLGCWDNRVDLENKPATATDFRSVAKKKRFFRGLFTFAFPLSQLAEF